jgi:hypothetical protein
MLTTGFGLLATARGVNVIPLDNAVISSSCPAADLLPVAAAQPACHLGQSTRDIVYELAEAVGREPRTATAR